MPEVIQYEGVSLWGWAALGIIITALAYSAKPKYGGWVLLFTVFSMLAYAKGKGKI